MPPHDDPPGPRPPDRDATAAHAAEVVARAAGADGLEAPLRPGQVMRGPDLARQRWQSPPPWERARPLEAPPPAPPQVPFARGWDARLGRAGGLRGLGRHLVGLLRGRRPY